VTLCHCRYQRETTKTDISAPDIRSIEAKNIIGLSVACSQNDIAGTPNLWRQFNERTQEISIASGNAYGICYGGDGKGNFRYLAGTTVSSTTDKPEGMELVDLPPGPHAVFTFDGQVTNFPSFV